MDYNYMEKLIALAKAGNKDAKEKILIEFTPLIKKIAFRTYISGYEKEDLENEGYLALLQAINNYDSKRVSFVAYGTMAIKNSINNLIRKAVNRELVESNKALTFDGSLENLNLQEKLLTENYIIEKIDIKNLNNLLKTLNKEEQELIKSTIIDKISIRKYAATKNLNYTTTLYRQKKLLKKLNKLFLKM